MTFYNPNSIFKKVFIALNLLFILLSFNLYSQNIKLNKSKFDRNMSNLNKKFPVNKTFENNPLTTTPENIVSDEESVIRNEMDQLKNPNNMFRNGERIVELQKRLESINHSTTTVQPSQNQYTMILPPAGNPEIDNLYSTNLFNGGGYVSSVATQVEQRGAGAGKIWVAVAHTDADTGIGAKPDTINIYYTINGGATYTLYMKVAFSSANKIAFDDLDMEIIEPSSGQKSLYLTFGYYTNGFLGQRLVGYIIVTTPTPAVFGSTLTFPGQTGSSKYFNARITSDNASYPDIAYVTISIMQDSTEGSNNYMMSKFCRIYNPYVLNPAITYFPKCIYGVVAGYATDIFTDIAYFNNNSDSIVFVLSGYPGFESSLYLYKAYGNSSVYPTSNGAISPTGDNLEYATIASNGGFNQKKLMIVYTDNYNNSGDFDQWALSTFDANNWNASTLEYSSLHNSKRGEVIGRRNASGSFSIAFSNYLNNMQNATTCTFNGDFNLATYLHCTNTGYSNSLVNPKPAFRYVNGDSCINTWAYFYSLNTASGCSGINAYVKAATEGYYDDNTGVTPIYDVMEIVLANQSSPYNFIDTALVYLDYQLLMNEIVFRNAADGDYYFVIKHRNALETWSSSPVSISHSFNAYYDFTLAAEQSYGNNTVQEGSTWCLYSGDVDPSGINDGIIDVDDVLYIYNDALNFIFGDYLVTDLNGDNFVDTGDILMSYNNSNNFVSVIAP